MDPVNTPTVILELTFDELCPILAAMTTMHQLLTENPAALGLVEALGFRNDFNNATHKLNRAYNTIVPR